MKRLTVYSILTLSIFSQNYSLARNVILEMKSVSKHDCLEFYSNTFRSTPFNDTRLVRELSDSIDTFLVLQNLIYNNFEGSEIAQFVTGDVDLDGDRDLVVIATRPCGEYESVSEHSVCFRLVIYSSLNRELFALSCLNEVEIECSDCYHSDPIIWVENGVIEITICYGACMRDFFTSKYVFEPSNNNWWLESIEKYTVYCNPVNNEIPIVYYPKSTPEEFGRVKL